MKLHFALCSSTDINECEKATHNCHGAANCYNNEGSFTCHCRDSYSGDGISNCDPLGKLNDALNAISALQTIVTVLLRSESAIISASV